MTSSYWGGGDNPYGAQNNSINFIDLGRGTIDQLRNLAINILTQQATFSVPANDMYARMSANSFNNPDFTRYFDGMASMLHMTICRRLHAPNQSNEQIMYEVANKTWLAKQVSMLETDQSLRTRQQAQNEDVFKQLGAARTGLLGVLTEVGRWADFLRQNNRTPMGPVNNQGGWQQPDQNARPVNNGHATAGTVYSAVPNTDYTRGVAASPNIGGELFNGRREAPVNLPPRVGTTVHDLLLEDDDDEPVHVAPPQPAYDEYRTVETFSHQPRTPHDIYNTANELNDQEHIQWETLHSEEGVGLTNDLTIEDNEVTSTFGQVVTKKRYEELRLLATHFDPKQPWPKLYDVTRFARRAYIDDKGMLHESIHPLEHLSRAEMEYLELEVDPEARNQAILNQQRLDQLSEAPVVYVSRDAEPKQTGPIIKGENKQMQLVMLKDVVTSTADVANEVIASSMAVRQTGQEITEETAIAYHGQVYEYLGTYANVGDFQKFLNAFNIDQLKKGDVDGIVQLLQTFKGVVPSRIWNNLDGRATADFNRWLRRIEPGKFPMKADSFAMDYKAAIDELTRTGLSADYIAHDLKRHGMDWLRSLHSLLTNRDTEDNSNTRIYLAELYGLVNWLDCYDANCAVYDKQDRELCAANAFAEATEKGLAEDEIQLFVAERMVTFEAARWEKVSPTEEQSRDAWWLNHSVFTLREDVVLRLPSTSRGLELTASNRYSHASAATNPAVCNLLTKVFNRFEKLDDLNRIVVNLSDGAVVYAYAHNRAEGNHEYVLELVKEPVTLP